MNGSAGKYPALKHSKWTGPDIKDGYSLTPVDDILADNIRFESGQHTYCYGAKLNKSAQPVSG